MTPPTNKLSRKERRELAEKKRQVIKRNLNELFKMVETDGTYEGRSRKEILWDCAKAGDIFVSKMLKETPQDSALILEALRQFLKQSIKEIKANQLWKALREKMKGGDTNEEIKQDTD